LKTLTGAEFTEKDDLKKDFLYIRLNASRGANLKHLKG